MCINYFRTLGIPFLSILAVQIGNVKRFYCSQKDASLVPWGSLSLSDETLLRDKYPDTSQGAIGDLCVRSARPSTPQCVLQPPFFKHLIISPQSVDSGLLMPSALLVVSGAAMSLATESVESEVVEPRASFAESSTAAIGSATGSGAHPPSTAQSDGQKVCANPSRPEKANQPRVLKKLTIAQRVEKYGKHGGGGGGARTGPFTPTPPPLPAGFWLRSARPWAPKAPEENFA